MTNFVSCITTADVQSSFQADADSQQLMRSLESPTVSLSDPSAFDFLGIGTQPIAAGVRVDRRTILTLDGWWRGVSLIAGSIARLPLYIYKGKRSGTNSIDEQHPAYRLLYQRPNDRQHSNYFKKCLIAHTLNHGNGYAYIERDGSGDPVRLHLLAPDRTYPILINSKLWYVTHLYTNSFGGADGAPDNKNEPISTTMMVIAPEDMLHFKGLGYDGLQGYTVFDMAAESAGRGLATGQYASRFFGNSAEPRILITLPAGQNWRPEVQQEFLRQWNMMHSGVSSAHRTALLTNGATVTPFSIDAEKSQLIEQRSFNIREIANFLNLPPHKLGDDSRTSYNSVEIENQSLVNDCYAPIMDEICRECEIKLLSERQKETYSHFVGFDATELMQPDAKTAAEADSLSVNNGLVTLDEVRAKRNQPAAPNGIGKKWRIPVNIGLIDEATGTVQGIPQKQGDMDRPAGTQKPADKKSDNPGLRAVFSDAAKRVYARLSQDCQRASAKPEKLTEWKIVAQERHCGAISEILLPSITLMEQPAERASYIANTSISLCVLACGDESKFNPQKIEELLCQVN